MVQHIWNPFDIDVYHICAASQVTGKRNHVHTTLHNYVFEAMRVLVQRMHAAMLRSMQQLMRLAHCRWGSVVARPELCNICYCRTVPAVALRVCRCVQRLRHTHGASQMSGKSRISSPPDLPEMGKPEEWRSMIHVMNT